MEKIALILIYNIFVTKFFFFQELTFWMDSVGWQQTNIFLSLVLFTKIEVKIVSSVLIIKRLSYINRTKAIGAKCLVDLKKV